LGIILVLEHSTAWGAILNCGHAGWEYYRQFVMALGAHELHNYTHSTPFCIHGYSVSLYGSPTSHIIIWVLYTKACLLLFHVSAMPLTGGLV